MDANTAMDLINGRMHYKPGSRITAMPSYLSQMADLLGMPEWRNVIEVTVAMDTVNTDQDMALRGYPEKITVAPSCEIDVTHMTPDALAARVMAFIIEAEIHEAREFFRVGDDMHAPFHPHRVEGAQAWVKLCEAEAQQS